MSTQWRDIAGSVGFFLGYPEDPTEWDSVQARNVARALKRGIALFVTPPPLDGELHDWSFLRRAAQLVTVSDTENYDAPEDFGGLTTAMTGEEGTLRERLDRVSELQLRELRRDTDTSGPPQCFAFRTKDFNDGKGERWEFMLWPTPDAAYTYDYRYRVVPLEMDESHPIPIGGELHAETVRSACLLGAALEFADEQAGEKQAEFMERIATSIALDRRVSTPDRLGRYVSSPYAQETSPPELIGLPHWPGLWTLTEPT